MPENDEQDISAGAQAPVETERERFERERLSRRQALKRFGMTSAMAAFAMFSVDDLARMVGKAMQQRACDNKVAEQVAREFQNAGVAFAASGPVTLTPACTKCFSDATHGSDDCGNLPKGTSRDDCNKKVGAALNTCLKNNKCPISTTS